MDFIVNYLLELSDLNCLQVPNKLQVRVGRSLFSLTGTKDFAGHKPLVLMLRTITNNLGEPTLDECEDKDTLSSLEVLGPATLTLALTPVIFCHISTLYISKAHLCPQKSDFLCAGAALGG